MGAVLYSRPGCHLCDDARAALDASGAAYEEVNIDRDPALKAEFGSLVPVVEVGGRLVFEAGMDPRSLAALVRAAGA